MSGTATIVWTNPTPSNQQELYYGKDSLVSGLPGSGGGWIADTGNPLSGTIGSQSVPNLDDNVKYVFLVRGDCSNTQDIYSRSSAIKWICGGIQPQGPIGGTLAYTLSVDPSVSNAGSAVGRIVVTLRGVDTNNGSVTYKTKIYTAPFSASYTDQFTGVIGNATWTLLTNYQSPNYPHTDLHLCSTSQFTTTSVPSTTLVHARNGLALGTLSQLVFNSIAVLGSALDAGNGTNIDVTATISNSSPVSIQCTIPDVASGTQLYARQIRGGIQVNGGIFTYTGSLSNISSVPWSIQNEDIIEIVDANTLGYVFRQPLFTKTSTPSNGYNITVSIDVPQGSNTTLTIAAREYDYSSGISSPITTGGLTIPQGLTKATIFVATSLGASQYANATITDINIGTSTTSVVVPYYYSI